ncbi:spherulation-specific family 4 protein [Streptomyces sp. 891-h]|uniref:spherulation-specific family 4 protein n=1 Tax=unclassified Streptomyces TaxID=2593676 RepID=UPI001FAB00C7|nr:spherulation-specific family 4 protein [Streptomyces sp. 891-h]UNZ17436.1 phage tail protein [Streptomyces sp. 891-h]
MPYLTTPPGRARPAGDSSGTVRQRLGIGVPGCAHPILAPLEWAELSRPGLGARPGIDGRPGAVPDAGPLHWAVLDIADGPGARPDPFCAPAAAALRAGGVAVLGRLDMQDGVRTFGELVSEAHRFLDWYRVDGFYLAHCPGDPSRLRHTQRLTATLRALCGGADGGTGGHLVLAHGCHPHPDYVLCADQLVTYAGSWADYRWSQAEEWTAAHPAERFCHLVHSLPRTHLEEALRIARWQGAGTVCFTDRTRERGQDPWAALPGYWDEIVSCLGPGVSE